ncbi:MAG: DNA-binding transcriptional regulator, MarR family [Candidatus Nomurabacteria bacterium]|nr:DNA-binding transcriptional regulator, MarR family [Candidatus Nomurabacteria bacterium]
MINRKQKLEELMKSIGTLQRNMAFRGADFNKMNRITPSQWGVVMLIEQQDSTSVKEVANGLGISSSAATQLIDGLVESGYVLRKENIKDRRIAVLTLSNKTKKHVGKMKEQMIKKFIEIYEVLTDKEFNQFCVLHNKIVQRLSTKNK